MPSETRLRLCHAPGCRGLAVVMCGAHDYCLAHGREMQDVAFKVAAAHVEGQVLGYAKGHAQGLADMRVAIQNRAILAPEAS